MKFKPLADPSATARDLWRHARRVGWHRSSMLVVIGWRAPSEEQARRLRKVLSAVPGYALAPPEAYEPEEDPLETVVHGSSRRLSAAEIEEHLDWARAFGAQFEAVVSRVGLERTGLR